MDEVIYREPVHQRNAGLVACEECDGWGEVVLPSFVGPLVLTCRICDGGLVPDPWLGYFDIGGES